jgi:hypothetical protein
VRVNTELCWRQREDQPSTAGVNVLQAKHIAKHGPGGVSL